MIVSPSNFAEIGQPITIEQIEHVLSTVVSEIDCNCIALSGGLDSSLLLWYMMQTRDSVVASTIGCSEDHPDVVHACLMVSMFPGRIHHRILILDKGGSGDFAVKSFYAFVYENSSSIIAGDGVDEFMCGYYAHQKSSTMDTYYSFLRRLLDEHLIPLDRNSGSVHVHLPYLDPRLISLFSQIPFEEKVSSANRKLLVLKMASGKLPSSIIDRWKYGFCDALQN